MPIAPNALICISNCENHPRHADGRFAPQYSDRLRLRRPMEAGKVMKDGELIAVDLIDAMTPRR